MPITNPDLWKLLKKHNPDPFGVRCARVAKRVMEILDEDGLASDPHSVMAQAVEDVQEGEFYQFNAFCVVYIVRKCHEHGEMFARNWERNDDRFNSEALEFEKQFLGVGEGVKDGLDNIS